jgi:hypothetical protein
VGMGSVEELVEELEGECGSCVECKMWIFDIARKRRQDTTERTMEPA